MTADDARTITWGSYRAYRDARNPALDGILLQRHSAEVVLSLTGRWPWQWPDRRGWPQRRQIDALVAPRLTEAQRRVELVRWHLDAARMDAVDALGRLHDAARALAGRTMDYER